MDIRRIIQKRIRAKLGGAAVDSDVNAAVAANMGERGSTTHVSSTQRASATSDSRPDEDRPRG